MNADLIEASLERAAERCRDLTPLVYARLFAEHPEVESLFVNDKAGLVRGEMLARVFEVILDFIGDRRYGARMIQCEVVTHEGYDVPRDVFAIFFRTVADTLRAVLGADWTPAVAEAWRALLDALDYYVSHPNQAETAA